MVHIKKETVNILEFKVGNNGNIANLLFLWKPRFANHTCDKRGHYDLGKSILKKENTAVVYSEF